MWMDRNNIKLLLKQKIISYLQEEFFIIIIIYVFYLVYACDSRPNYTNFEFKIYIYI